MPMRFKPGLIILMTLAACLLATGGVLAQIPGQSGAATVYEVTITQVEICTDSACGTTFVLGNNSTTFDLASASAGADVGSFATSDGIPVGVPHSHVRLTFNRDITITGSVEMGLGTADLCTTRNGQTQGTASRLGLGTTGADGTATSQALFVPSEATALNRGSDGAATGTTIAAGTFASTFNIDNVTATQMTITYPLGQTFTKQAGDPDPRIEVQFNTADALGAANTDTATTGNAPQDCSLFPRPPDVLVTITTP